MLLSRSPRFALLGLLSVVSCVFAKDAQSAYATPNRTTVLILGGGMTGVIAARTLHEQGIDDFIILEAKNELGGRISSRTFGEPGKQYVVETGAQWIHGTQQDNGPANPVWELALKHNLSTVYNDIYGSVTTFNSHIGYQNFTDVLETAINNFAEVTIRAGQRIEEGQVDLSLKSAYGLMGFAPRTIQEDASDYFLNDFSPAQTSWLASSWHTNFTYVPEAGGFSDVDMMSIDQRGFAYILQAEAAEFLQPKQVIFNETVNLIEYSKDDVTVHTESGLKITADHVICTFSVGVLQNSDVVFQPPLPDWKVEAINTIEMGAYTKVFMQFNESFWFPTQMALLADVHRGKYPVWQSLDHPGFLPGSSILTNLVTGDWSPYIEGLPPSGVAAQNTGDLQAMFPNVTIPPFTDHYITTWTTDKLFRGAFSVWGPSYVPYHSINLRASVDNHLWFAGEATSVKYFGLLQGAYFEGQKIGSYLAGCIQGTGSCERSYVQASQSPESYASILSSS